MILIGIARRDGDMRADQIGPGKIEVSDVRAPAPHEPVEVVGGQRDMRRVTHKRSLVPCQPRRGGNLNACLLNLFRPLAALGQTKDNYAPARRCEPGQRANEVTLSPANSERLGDDEEPAV